MAEKQVKLQRILAQEGAQQTWDRARQLGVREQELKECLEAIANRRRLPYPPRMRRRQVEAFTKRLRAEANNISDLNIHHADLLPGPPPANPSLQFGRLLDNNPTWHLLLPEMLEHYAVNLDRVHREETPRQRSSAKKLTWELEVVHLMVVASSHVDRRPLPTRIVSAEGIGLKLYILAAELIQDAYDTGGIERTADPDNLRQAYQRLTLRHQLSSDPGPERQA